MASLSELIADARTVLRSLPALVGTPPPFDPEQAPETPAELYMIWLRLAIAAGVKEPHAMVLSTADAQGMPDARTLILKDVDETGWAFASSATSVKGHQLSHSPVAALTSYWPVLGRQVRLRGGVVEAECSESASDFLARPVEARAQSLLGRQSEPLTSPAQIDLELAEVLQRVRDEPALVAPNWRVYRVVPEQVEFMQASPDRRHTRLQYRRLATGWEHGLLWP